MVHELSFRKSSEDSRIQGLTCIRFISYLTNGKFRYNNVIIIKNLIKEFEELHSLRDKYEYEYDDYCKYDRSKRKV